MKDIIDNLSVAVHQLQGNTIGLFYNLATKKFELVLDEDTDKTLHTVDLYGGLGGFSENHCLPKSYGIYKKFPDGKSLLDMKRDPFELDAFCKSFGV